MGYGHSHAGIGHFDQYFRGGREIAAHQNGAGLTLLGSGEIGFFLGEREIPGAGVVGGSEAGDFDGTVAQNPALELFRNLRSCKMHSHEVMLSN